MKHAVLAVIRESECIGCTKCIDACPFDAIIGSNKHMHTVINDDCSGCKLCIPVCPVDCIDLSPAPFETPTKERVLHYGERVKARKMRLRNTETPVESFINPAADRMDYIQQAIERAKQKKLRP